MSEDKVLTLTDVCQAHFERRVDCVAVVNKYIGQQRELTREMERKARAYDLIASGKVAFCKSVFGEWMVSINNKVTMAPTLEAALDAAVQDRNAATCSHR